MYLLLNMVIFQCHVRFQGNKPLVEMLLSLSLLGGVVGEVVHDITWGSLKCWFIQPVSALLSRGELIANPEVPSRSLT